jgi:dTDP-4-amino-4,6-dideoxygalactose transaminase
MRVPLLDINRQNAALGGELRAACERVLGSGQFILGPELEQFERALAGLTGTRHAIGVSSGTDAILLALMALEIGPGDEVLCPAFTFFATAGCVARAGATPVFADSCPVCFNLDVADARRRITPRTRAILPVHLFGQAAEMDEVMALAREHRLRVIEDAAQALGAASHGRPAGSMGDFGTFSFYPSKNLGGFGDAGLLVTSDDVLGEKARRLRTHGAKARYFHELVGGNFRLDALQAALLGVKLPHLEEYSARRASNASYYREQLGRLPGVAANSPTTCACRDGHGETGWSRTGVRLVLPAAYPYNKHIWNQYTVRVIAGPDWKGAGNPRDALVAWLDSRGIGSAIYYPLPLHRQECFSRGSTPPALPVAERLSEECLSIPVYPELTREQLDAVVEAIGAFLGGG